MSGKERERKKTESEKSFFAAAQMLTLTIKKMRKKRNLNFEKIPEKWN